MKRNEMIAQLQASLQEPTGGLGAPAKFRLNYLLNRATNDICAKYKCLYGTASGDLVANQIQYAAPTSTAETTNVDIIEIYAATLYDSSGNLHTLQMRTPQGMDADYPGWRAWVAGTCPVFCVTLAQSAILFTPTPNYNSVFDPLGITGGGFTLEGIALPGLSWQADTAECPLPTQVHEAVVDQACLYRIKDNPSKDNIARIPLIKESLQSTLDTFESSVLRYTMATRVPSYTTGDNVGASPGTGFNPLDQ